MNNRLFIAWITAATITGSAVSAVATPPTCDTSFRVSSGSWHNGANWTGNEPPGDDDVACVLNTPSTKTATVDYGLCVGGEHNGEGCTKTGSTCPENCDPRVAKAEALVVDSGCVLEIQQYAILTVTAAQNNSWVDGELLEFGNGTLRIKSNLTVEGDGVLQAYWEEGTCWAQQSIIDVDELGECVGGENNALPCAPCSVGEPCPGGTCSPPATYPTLTIGSSAELRGRWKACVPIENDGLVVSDCLMNPLTLECDGNSGSGTWRVQTDSHYGGACEFQVNGTVTGSAEWQIAELGTLEVNTATSSLTLSGDVTITGGTIEANQDFATSGHLEMSSGTIEVANGKAAVFN